MTIFLILLAILGLALVVALVHDLRHGRVGAPPPRRYDWSTEPHSRPYRSFAVPGSSRAYWLY